MKIWLLKKLGIYDFVWRQFCDEYPVRLSGKSPELKRYFSENEWDIKLVEGWDKMELKADKNK